MTYSERVPARPRATVLATVVLAGAALVGIAAAPIDLLQGDSTPTDIGIGRQDDRRDPQAPSRPLGQADGALPDGVTVFNADIPGVARIDPDLLGALRRAATDAADDGVTFFVNSGWRSPEYQEHLRQQAVSKYGSQREAARLVATADKSAHVSGDAVDIGPARATEWLARHGADYGLCQIYSNERWHYELRPEAINHGCPSRYADLTEDPRMQQDR